MEQGNCLDSTLVSAAQNLRDVASEESKLDTAVTALLVSPSKDLHAARAPLPEPGSPEAIAMFRAACTESDRLSHNAVHGYPELKRTNLEWWTRDTLGRALEDGDLMPADYAKLYRLACEREHCIDAAMLATDIGPLHALAFAEDYGRLSQEAAPATNGAQVIETGAVKSDLPPPMPGEWLANSPTPELFALVSEWITLDAELSTRAMDDDELNLKGDRSCKLHSLICAFEARCFEDMQMKTAIYRYEGRDARSPEGDPPSMAEAAWLSVVRDIEALGDKQPIRGLGIYDPAYPVIEEGRRLLRAYLDTHHIYEQDPTTIDPRPEWTAAWRALNDYLKDTILQTVPLTAGACRELARFAVEYSDAMECQISDGDEEVISRLIAQSPLLDEGTENTNAGPVFALAKAEAHALGLSALGINELSALYAKLGATRELWGAAMCEPVAVAGHCARGFVVRSHYGSRAEFEDARAAFLMDRIASEISSRPAIDDQERDNQLALRIQQEIACEGRILTPALLADIALAWG